MKYKPPSETQEHLLNCLARWMLDHWKTVEERRASLHRMWLHRAKPKGKAGNYENAARADRFIEDLKRRVRDEHEKRKQVRSG